MFTYSPYMKLAVRLLVPNGFFDCLAQSIIAYLVKFCPFHGLGEDKERALYLKGL